MKTNLYDWIPFYEELAQKLRSYNTPEGRKKLVEVVKRMDTNGKWAYSQFEIMDPFTIFCQLNDDNTESWATNLSYLAQEFGILSPIPTNSTAIPQLVYTRHLYAFPSDSSSSVRTVVPILWNLFEAAMTDNRADELKYVDQLIAQGCTIDYISRNLAWILPSKYFYVHRGDNVEISALLKTDEKFPISNASQYFQLLDRCRLLNIPLSAFYQMSKTASCNRKFWVLGYTMGSDDKLVEFVEEGRWYGLFSSSSRDQKQCAESLRIRKGDYVILKCTYTQGKKHSESVFEVKALGIATEDARKENSEKGYEKVEVNVDYFSTDNFTLVNQPYSHFRNTVGCLEGDQYKGLCTYAEEILMKGESKVFDGAPNESESPKTIPAHLQKYVDLLEENHNLIIHGAPGTGKTYLTQEIADALAAESAFVQFHPSYDYADFVEGLRPIMDDDKIGFERQDGIFKDFCRNAWKNCLDAQKNVEELGYEDAALLAMEAFISDAIASGKKLKTDNDAEFTIVDEQKQRIYLHNEKCIKDIPVSKKEIYQLLLANKTVKDGKDSWSFFGRKYRSQQDTYLPALYQSIKATIKPSSVEKVNKKKYLFIIDEINRGEISKIFGELFYVIDPGYRSTEEKQYPVRTQYQSLVDQDEDEVFYKGKGFFVPDNVYILGTMNDIDRSVDTMDFAMRRRFAFYNLTAAESAENMHLNDEQKAYMERINIAISNVEGLNSSYHIGASYFRNVTDFEKLWNLKLEGLLREYLRGLPGEEELLEVLKVAYFNTAE